MEWARIHFCLLEYLLITNFCFNSHVRLGVEGSMQREIKSQHPHWTGNLRGNAPHGKLGPVSSIFRAKTDRKFCRFSTMLCFVLQGPSSLGLLSGVPNWEWCPQVPSRHKCLCQRKGLHPTPQIISTNNFPSGIRQSENQIHKEPAFYHWN